MRYLQSVQLADYNESKRAVRIYKDSDTGEFVCKLYTEGKHFEPADYFTNEFGDAFGTAEFMCMRQAQHTLTIMRRMGYSSAKMLDALNKQCGNAIEQGDIMHWKFPDNSMLYYNQARDGWTH